MSISAVLCGSQIHLIFKMGGGMFFGMSFLSSIQGLALQTSLKVQSFSTIISSSPMASNQVFGVTDFDIPVSADLFFCVVIPIYLSTALDFVSVLICLSGPES